MKRVVIIEPQLKQYRRRFVGDLAARLRAHDVELVVAYSEPSRREAARGDTIELDDGIGVKVPSIRLWNDRVVLQRAWPVVRDAALDIIDQGNRQLFNYALLALSQLGLKRVAFWGHGYNHQAPPTSISERLKRTLVTRVDWWFAYTDGVSRYLIEHGVSPSIISSVQNTIDVDELATAVAIADRSAIRARLGMSRASRVGLFCGALVADKQLAFVVDAAAVLRQTIPDFELVIVGEGPERSMLQAIAAYRPYIHVVGPAFGVERAQYFAIADLFVMPAQVGLAVVDAFAAGLPLATTSAAHGPEIEYLSPGENGVITTFDIDVYAAAIARVLEGPELTRLQHGARRTAERLTLDHMVGRFTDGILRCLEAA